MYILLIIALLIVTAFFVLAEFAFYSAKKARLQAAADKGNKAAITAIALIENPNRYLSTTQIGITLATIALGMYGEASLTDDLVKWSSTHGVPKEYAHPVATATTIISLTVISLVAAEMVPKRLAQMYPESLARLLARPTDWLSRLSAPIVAVLSFCTDILLRLVPEPEQHEQAAQEEVKAILASGAEQGFIHQAQQQLVERIFQLSDRRVKSLMVPRNDIDALDVADPAGRVRVAVATSAHSHFPVCDGDLDHLVGVVHVKDLVKHGLMLGGADDLNLRALARKPYFVPESATALRVLEQFKQRNTHLAFVLDEYGVLVGLVTLNDLVEAMLGQLPLPGAASSTADEPLIVKRNDNSYLLDAMLPVADLKSLMGVDTLPRQTEADFDTLGGFVIANLGRVPAIGDRFAFDRFTFEVVDMDRTRVDRVMLDIQPVLEADAGEDI